METVSAKTILDFASRRIGWDLTQLELRQQQNARDALSLALKEAWESWWWDELMTCAPMPGATVYTVGATFTAGQFCYYPATQGFFQCVQTCAGQAPAARNSAGAYVLNAAYWANAVAIPTANDFDATLTYGVGDQVRDPVDGNFYQCIIVPSGVIVAGAGMTGINGIYPAAGTSNGRTAYATANLLGIRWNGHWFIGGLTPNGATLVPAYFGYEDVATPDLVSTWRSCDTGGNENNVNDPPPAVLSAMANPSVNSYCWAQLLPFIPTMAIGGKVRSVTRLDPRGTRNPGPYHFEQADALQVFNLTQGVPWIWRRRPVPILTGDAWSATATYETTPASQLIFDSNPT